MVSADALPADDVFYFSVERADARHALFVHEADNSRDLLYFKAALEASGQSAFAIVCADTGSQQGKERGLWPDSTTRWPS